MDTALSVAAAQCGRIFLNFSRQSFSERNPVRIPRLIFGWIPGRVRSRISALLGRIPRQISGRISPRISNWLPADGSIILGGHYLEKFSRNFQRRSLGKRASRSRPRIWIPRLVLGHCSGWIRKPFPWFFL